MSTSMATSEHQLSKPLALAHRMLEHWLQIFIVLFGIFWFTPFLAPVFMRLGWTVPGQFIYDAYSTQCHQMAQRSFFFFGTKLMYSPAELPVTLSANEAANMLAYRQFVGNAELGWKVAWSDRMVSMYGGILLGSICFWLWRRHYRPRWRYTALFLFLLIPMIVDGVTHFLSDISGGIVGGFRYTNGWFATLTNNSFPAWFYIGDAFGSFNSWVRLVTGVLFGIGFVGLAFPIFDRAIREALAEHQQ